MPMPPTTAPESCTAAGAAALAARIEAVWAAAGHPEVKCWLESGRHRRGSATETYFWVRSNLVDGLPPRGSSRAA